MDKNKVSVTQVSLLLLLVITGGKFLSLPALLSKDVGHDSWLVIAVAFAWDLIGLCFLLWGIKLNKNNLSIDGILDKSVSKVVSKIIMFIFFVMFMCRTMVLLDSCYSTFAVTFDVNTNWILFMLPIVAVAGFAIYRGFNSVARVSQVLFALIILSLVAILIYPATQTEFSQLLPLGEVGAGKIFGTAIMRSFWFSDYVFIYFVLDNLKPKKRLFTPILVSFAVGVALTLLLNIVFVSLFGSFAQYAKIAMSKIGMFSISESTDGRWDWLTLTVWLTSVIIKVIVFIFCAYKCVEKILGLHFVKFNLPTIGAIAAILIIPMFIPSATVVEKFVQWCVIPFAIVQYVLPLCMPLFVKVAHRSSKLEVINEQS